MTTDSHYLDDIHAMDDQIEQIIGRKVFGHVAAPTPTSLRITFADGYTAVTMVEAHEYMFSLFRQAQHDPSKLPWPLTEAG